MSKSIEELLEAPYWVMDILPEQVRKDSPGQFFAVERYYLTEPRLADVKRRHVNVILKLNCYRSVSLDEETVIDPPPERIAEAIMTRYVILKLDDSMIVSAPDELYLTVYAPDEPLLETLKALCAGEGLFVWKP